MPRAWIAFGANLGNARETCVAACHLLADTPGWRVCARSRLYETAPMGSLAGDRFTNAVIETEIDPECEPLTVLDRLQAIEQALGRQRVVHWGPRTVDLDWIAAETPQVFDSSRLTLPHRHSWYRRFVLDPWAELAPEWIVPGRDATVRELRQRLYQRPLVMQVCGPTAAETATVLAILQQQLMVTCGRWIVTGDRPSDRQPTIYADWSGQWDSSPAAPHALSKGNRDGNGNGSGDGIGDGDGNANGDKNRDGDDATPILTCRDRHLPVSASSVQAAAEFLQAVMTAAGDEPVPLDE
jgi:2-amino-4-hydroxy-6-hydroxymethyldihydropteridine diphosphokinase